MSDQMLLQDAQAFAELLEWCKRHHAFIGCWTRDGDIRVVLGDDIYRVSFVGSELGEVTKVIERKLKFINVKGDDNGKCSTE